MPIHLCRNLESVDALPASSMTLHDAIQLLRAVTQATFTLCKLKTVSAIFCVRER